MQIAVSAEEVSALNAALTAFLSAKSTSCQVDIDRLHRLLGDKLSSGDHTPLIAECVATFDRDIAKRAAPEIFSEIDDDGLIEISKLQLVGPGVYRHGELALFAHRHFRRSSTPLNGLNDTFLAELTELPVELRPRVALDPDLVGLVDTYLPHLEHQYWWGPQFNDDLSTIPVGVTRHDMLEHEHFFSGVERTEFRWGTRDGERIFEVEEVRDVPTLATDDVRYACRYAHSIISKEGELGHFDGAVREYDQEAINGRRTVDMSHAERASRYRKLWRVDGSIPVPLWKRLLSDYFRDNHLIGEYLGAPPSARFGPIAPPMATGLRRKDSPAAFRIERGTGVRAGLSFRSLPERDAQVRHIWPSKRLGAEGGSRPMIEADSIELVKAMARQGRQLSVDPSVVLLAVEDMDINLATVWHPDPSSVPKTLEAILELVQAWIARDEDRLLGFSVAYQVGRAAAILSVCGHITDVADVIQRWEVEIQPALTDPVRLADALQQMIGRGSADDPQPEALALLTCNRVLEVDRLEVERTLCELEATDAGLKITLLLDASDNSYPVGDIEAGRVRPVVAFSIDESICAACREDYRVCGCSKTLDAGCHQIVIKAAPLFVYLTQRPAHSNAGPRAEPATRPGTPETSSP